MSLSSKIPPKVKNELKARVQQARRLWVGAFRSYGREELLAALRALGVERGSTVMVHSSFGDASGFRGTAEDLIDVFEEAVGAGGNLLMVSLPYRTSSLDYLSRERTFDVRKTPSMMGLVTEYFRRRPDVRRSLHPTHPVLAWGAKADWIVAGHEHCRYPCGPETPFHRLEQLGGMAIFFNVPFATFTFFHYLEHLVSPAMPFSLYTAEPFVVPVVDGSGERSEVTTYVFSRDVIARRRFPVLEDELRRQGLIAARSVGNTRIEAVRVRRVVECVKRMFGEGRYFYDVSGLPAPNVALMQEG
jgi:aminoglycoside 3-N-acetyltransferase